MEFRGNFKPPLAGVIICMGFLTTAWVVAYFQNDNVDRDDLLFCLLMTLFCIGSSLLILGPYGRFELEEGYLTKYGIFGVKSVRLEGASARVWLKSGSAAPSYIIENKEESFTFGLTYLETPDAFVRALIDNGVRVKFGRRT